MTAAVGVLCVVATLGGVAPRPDGRAPRLRRRTSRSAAATWRCSPRRPASTCSALTLSQALIASSTRPRVAIGWGDRASLALAVVTILGHDLLLRVELGFLAGAVAAAVAMGAAPRGADASRRGGVRADHSRIRVDRPDSLRRQARTGIRARGR